MTISCCTRCGFPISAWLLALAICYFFSIESRALADNRVTESSCASCDDILNKHQGRGRSALRARVDVRRHRLWVLDLDHVYLYDTRKRQLVHQFRLPNWSVANFICPPDLVVDHAGIALVSNNVQPRLLRIDAATMRQQEYRLTLVSSKQWETGFGALAFGADGTLFALSALTGALFKIDLATAKAQQIPLTESVTGACELQYPGQNHPPAQPGTVSLCVGREGRPMRIDMSSDFSHGHATAESCRL